jgi:hypothetical protein
MASLTSSMRRPELSRVDVMTDQRCASDLRPFTLLPSALCRLHSQADIATIFLNQKDIRQGFPCVSLPFITQIDHVFFGLVQPWIISRLRATSILNSLGCPIDKDQEEENEIFSLWLLIRNAYNPIM